MKKTILFAGFAGLAFVVTAMPVCALDNIHPPYAEQGEVALEYAGNRTFDRSPTKNDAEEHEIALEYGPTSWWVVETSAGLAKDPGGNVKLDHAELESRFQFFDPGEYWLDTGLLLAYDFTTRNQQPDSGEVKVLLQKDFGKISSTANIGFSQDVGRFSASGGPDYAFLWNTRYRLNEYFQPGLELQSDLGQAHRLGHFDLQQHYLGPAVWGRLFGHLKYQVAFFRGISDASAEYAARLQLELEQRF